MFHCICIIDVRYGFQTRNHLAFIYGVSLFWNLTVAGKYSSSSLLEFHKWCVCALQMASGFYGVFLCNDSHPFALEVLKKSISSLTSSSGTIKHTRSHGYILQYSLIDLYMLHVLFLHFMRIKHVR